MYAWDMRQRKCLYRYKDYGSVHTTVLSNSPKGLFQATGYYISHMSSSISFRSHDSGVVNIYEYSSLGNSKTPVPRKEIMNLRTGSLLLPSSILMFFTNSTVR